MKITLEHYGHKNSVEIDHDDGGVEDIKVLLRALLILSGWGEDLIQEMIVGDILWRKLYW